VPIGQDVPSGNGTVQVHTAESLRAHTQTLHHSILRQRAAALFESSAIQGALAKLDAVREGVPQPQ